MSDLNIQRLLDRVGLQILNILQENGRITYAELGRQVSLSTPAIIERIRKMEETGILSGYQARVDASKVGWPILAFMSLSTRAESYPRVLELAKQEKGILECHHVSGNESFVMKVYAPSIRELEALIERFSPFGQTKTLIVLSSPIDKPGLELGAP